MMPPERLSTNAPKLWGLPYTSGPHIDRLSLSGGPQAFSVSANPHIPGARLILLSGSRPHAFTPFATRPEKTRGLWKRNMNDLCASPLQRTILEILLDKLKHLPSGTTGVSVCGHRRRSVCQMRSGVRQLSGENYASSLIVSLDSESARFHPPDNAAMVAIAG